MGLFNKKVWRPVSIATILLSVLCITGTSVAGTYESIINETLDIETSRVEGGEKGVYYASDFNSLEEMYQAKVKTIREIADEGVVLLKNEGNALPLKSGKITILGEKNFIYSTGTGGGSISATMKERSATLSGALTTDGLTVNTDEKNISGSNVVLVVIGRVAGEGADLPADTLGLTDVEKAMIETAKKSGAKVAVLLSGDHPIEASELKHDSGISAILRFGNAGYRGAYGVADVITGKANPSGKLVDTLAADSYSSPAMQNFGNYTYTNGGKIKTSQAKNYVSYNEGIYIDYKYYETRYEDCVLQQGNASSSAGVYASTGNWNYADEVVYGYGYGLSYTSFAKEIVGEPVFDDQAHTATVKVKVTNTGDAAGKEVVQLYAQSPYTDYDKANKVEKASVQLMGYAKTGELAAGASETVEIVAPLQWLASYDYANAETYVMDAGDYYFSIGNGAHDALNHILAAKGKTIENGMTEEGNPSLTYRWTEGKLDKTTYAKSVYTGETIKNLFADADINHWVNGAVTYLSRSDWKGTYPQTLKLTASENMLASLNDTKKYENGKWNDEKNYAEVKEVKYRDYTTVDEVNAALQEAGATLNVADLRGKAYDDEGWESILDNLSIFEMSRMVAQGRSFIQACPSVTFPQSGGGDGPIGLGRAFVYSAINRETGEKTALPTGYTMSDGITSDKVAADDALTAKMFASEPVLGATFNRELAAKQGYFWGEDGLYCNTAFTWAPGANLHRTPYGGRVSEYVSADPVHTSTMLAPLVKAANEKGQILTVKHFALNEQEQNRIGVATFSNEQAIRENYLRAFEGVMTYGEARGLMSSYNRLGLLPTQENYHLLTDVLRKEWGSTAYIITDLGSPTAGLYNGNASIVAGVSTMMNNGVYDDASKAYVNQTLTADNIKKDAMLLTATREACHRILFNFIHSNAVNGISSGAKIVLITPWWKTALTVLDVVFTIMAVASTVLYVVSANQKEGV